MECMRQICVRTHTYDYVVYELPFLPNNAANLYTSLEGYLLWGAGLAVTRRIRYIGQNFYNLVFNRGLNE
jgi:hypothetical protein